MDSDLASLLSTNLSKSLDPVKVDSLLACPPFIPISGSFNVRDIGYNTSGAVRQGYILRAGSLENLTADGQSELQTLGIKTIFDLRSEKEKHLFPTADIPSVENKWFPSTTTNITTADAQIPKEPAEPFTLTSMYLEILQTHKPSYRAVFEHIRDHPEKPFLFHCTAGKDRTGLLAALILAISGVELAHINYEYALTRVGIEPVRDMLLAKLAAGNFKVDMNSPRMAEYNKMPLDWWTSVFEQMEGRYGGVAGYVRDELQFTNADIAKIRAVLRGA